MKKLLMIGMIMLAAVSSLKAVDAGYQLTAIKTDQAPALTAQMDEAIWDKATVLKNFWELNSLKPAPLNTHVQVCYDDEALYVRVIAFDSNLFERTNSFNDENSIEVFVVPSNQERDAYLQLISTPVGKVIHAKYGTSKVTDNAYKVSGKISFQDYFILDFRIPFMIFSKLPKQGDCWRLGVARNTKQKKGNLYYSLTPARNMFADTANFVRVTFPKAAVSQDLTKKLELSWQREYEGLKNDVMAISRELKDHEQDLKRLYLAEPFAELQRKIRENTRESGSKLRQIRHLRTLREHARALQYHFRLRLLASPESAEEK